MLYIVILWGVVVLELESHPSHNKGARPPTDLAFVPTLFIDTIHMTLPIRQPILWFPDPCLEVLIVQCMEMSCTCLEPRYSPTHTIYTLYIYEYLSVSLICFDMFLDFNKDDKSLKIHTIRSQTLEYSNI